MATRRLARAERPQRHSVVEFAVWAVLTVADLAGGIAFLAVVVDRGVHGEPGFWGGYWEPVAGSALGSAFLFVVGCYALTITRPGRGGGSGSSSRG